MVVDMRKLRSIVAMEFVKKFKMIKKKTKKMKIAKKKIEKGGL
jgi:hypothetical protein